MKNKNMFLSIIAILFAIVCSLNVNALTYSDDDIASGTSGTCSWVIDADGKLTIAPTDGESGTLKSWSSASSVPWYKYREHITSVYVESGVSAQTCAYMFYYCTSLTEVDLSNLDTSSVTDMSCMFYYCTSLTEVDLSNLDTSSATTMDYMFMSCYVLEKIDLSNWDTSSVTDMSYMFCNDSLISDFSSLSSFDTGNVIAMISMFSGCISMTNTDFLSNWDVSNVQYFTYTFYYCSGLITANLSGWNTSSATNTASMFNYCTSLTRIYVGDDWDVSNVKNTSQFTWTDSFSLYGTTYVFVDSITRAMFYNCYSLVGQEGTTYDSSNVGVSYAVIDSVVSTGTPGYLSLYNPITIKISVSVSLIGKTLEADMFEYTLYINDEAQESVTNDEDGNCSFEVTLNDEGEYTFTIAPTEDDINIDYEEAKSFTVTIEMVDFDLTVTNIE